MVSQILFVTLPCLSLDFLFLFATRRYVEFFDMARPWAAFVAQDIKSIIKTIVLRNKITKMNMRTFTFKSLFLTVLFVLLGSLAIQAADDGLITRQIKLELDEAGTLPNKIAVSRKNLITNLKIVGKINGTDLKFIRQMAGRDVNGEKTYGKLSILDLSEAKIVAGGDAYVRFSENYYTSNDKLGDSAFEDCSGLTSLTLPSGVTSIGRDAFRGCSGLTSLTIPSSVTSISDRAFDGCSGLTSIYAYLEKIPKLGSDVFTGCDAKNCILYVPTGTYDDYFVSEFGYFENIVDGINKDGLLTTQVTIKLDEAGTLPDRIGENQKYLITNLKIVGKINGTDLKFIREMAGRDFNGEKTDGKLSILDLSEAKIVAGGSAYFRYGDNYYTSNDKLGDHAFHDCNGLTSLTIPSGVTSIGWGAFAECSGLTSLTIPSSVTSIGNYAFHGCSGLTSLTLPSGVTSIGWGAFGYCSGLTSLTLPSSVTSIGGDAFYGCSGLTSLTLPSGVTSIGEEAFVGCSGLTSLTLPSGVTSIGRAAFYGCSGLTSLTIPSGVTSIGDQTFYGCSGLTSLTIPSGVTSIGNDAFYGCSGLTSLTLPSGVTSIGGLAFEGCSGLTSLTLPSSVTSIGGAAFEGCSGLTSLTLPSGVTSIGNFAFSGCSGLTSLTIPSGVTSISDFAFFGCSGLTSLTLPSGVTSIGNYAFSDCSGLTSLTLPSSVTEIGWYAFADCSGLTSLTIPSGVTEIGWYAF